MHAIVTLVALSSNGQDSGLSNRERGFDSRRGYHPQSSRDAALAQTDRALGFEPRGWGIVPSGRRQTPRSSAEERRYDTPEAGGAAPPVETKYRSVVKWQTHRPQKAARVPAWAFDSPRSDQHAIVVKWQTRWPEEPVGKARTSSNLVNRTSALVAQSAEAVGSNPTECWFDSNREHHVEKAEGCGKKAEGYTSARSRMTRPPWRNGNAHAF